MSNIFCLSYDIIYYIIRIGDSMKNYGEVNFEPLDKVKVIGPDSRIPGQDARSVQIEAGGVTKKAGDLMMGDPRDNEELLDTEYINVEEFLEACGELFAEKQAKQITMKKTGKKLKPEKIKEVVKQAREIVRITVEKCAKVTNQEAKVFSVKTDEMPSDKKLFATFLGKNGIPLDDGEYVRKEDIEFTITKVRKRRVPIHVNWVSLMKGLSTVATIVGLLALIPSIMHANSVMWHHSNSVIQDFLHAINIQLGKLVEFTFDGSMGRGLWITKDGGLFNADAATANILPAIFTYGLTAAGITKLVVDLKNGVRKLINVFGGLDPNDFDGDGESDIDTDSDMDDDGGKSL